MGRFKNTLLLLLAAMLLVAGGLLPTAVSGLRDKAVENVVQYGDGEALKLESAAPGPSFVTKLRLLNGGRWAAEMTQQTQMTGEEIIAAAYGAIDRYTAMGLWDLSGEESSISGLETALVYDEIQPEISNIFWWIHLDFSWANVTMVLDDATGTVIAMEYIVFEGAPYQPVNTQEDLYARSALLEEAYFSALSLNKVDAVPQEEPAKDDGYILLRNAYLCADDRGNEAKVEMAITVNGFWIAAA